MDPTDTALHTRGSEELQPTLLLEPRHEPERHIEEHDHRDERRDCLEHLTTERERSQNGAKDEERHHGCDGRGGHAHQNGPPILIGSRRLEVAEEHRDQEHGLESFAEDDHERLAEHDGRGAETLVSELPLGVVDEAAQVHDVRADLVDGRAVRDQPTDLGELRLGVGSEARADDPQRHLDELEVAEVAALRLVERLLRVALLDQLEGAIDRLADDVELADSLGT